MQVSDLVTECSLHVHDISNDELSKTQWLTFIRSAAQDLRDSGWLRRQDDDTSLVVLANTYTYAVPSGFAYVQELRAEEVQSAISVFVREVPRNHWDIHLEGGIPVLFFFSIGALENGRHLMVVGQKRPTIYATLDDTVDPGMSAFLRERACAYAFQFLGGGVSEYARWRQVLANQKWQASEALLRRHPQEFRVRPASVVVPGAE